MKKLITATAWIALTTATAFAADLPQRPTYVPVAAPAPMYNWTGIYLGINGGYGFGQVTPLSLFSNEYSQFDYNANGGVIGGTFGAQIQSGHVVIGLEGDLDWANIKGSGSNTISRLGIVQGTATLESKVSSISTLRTRVGYAEQNWLFYGTFGLALTNDVSTVTSSTFVCGSAGNLPCSSVSDLHIGLAAGAGVEYGFTPNLSTKLEYMWVGAGSVNTLKENMVRVGLNYRFGN